ncbi:MAG TPA: hypothetical protein VJG32_21825 [Anaerolineae bacterium]|nr:hypothetical protein [Anaerolineae bacterium]
MKTYLVRSLIIVAALSLIPLGAALAHGEPVIGVEPTIVAAGGQITVTGTEMEPGEVFAITLEGPTGSVSLGEAAVTGEGEEGGFTATFTIAAETMPGSYTVRAATEEGEATVADLTVTAPTAEASTDPAMIQEPTGEEHLLDRTRPAGETAAVLAAAVVSLVLGFWLIRRH